MLTKSVYHIYFLINEKRVMNDKFQTLQDSKTNILSASQDFLSLEKEIDCEKVR